MIGIFVNHGVQMAELQRAGWLLAQNSGLDPAAMESLLMRVERAARHNVVARMCVPAANDGEDSG